MPLGLELLSQLREKLLGYRKRLLDLSLRNRLLNWKPSKRFTLNLDGYTLPEAYAAILENEANLVELIPRYDEQAYEELGRKVPTRVGFISDLDEEALAAKCLLARRESDALERDSGINHTHLILGFLEWYDDHGPAKALRAPLILVPVKMVRSDINRVTGIPEYTVGYDETEIIVNPCLVEKLKDFHITIPGFTTSEGEPPDSEGVAKFLSEMEDIARNRPKWNLVHETKISFLSFSKLRMWRDLDPDQWPEDGRLEDKHLIQALFSYAAANEGADSAVTGRSIEDDPKADNLPLVVSADSSQHEAIADVVRGLNMVIQGPPGTGKSQSITNIIAALMHEGKSVLFVAEKFAALDIVKRNLQEVGLGDFCLELHGTKASKPAVYAELKSRLETSFRHPTRLASVRKEWEAMRKLLNGYVAAASKRVGPRDETYFEIVGKVERLRGRGINAPMDLVGNGDPCEKFHDREQFLTETQQLIIDRKVPLSHAWSDLEAGDLDAGHEDNLVQPLTRIVQLLEFLLQAENFVNHALRTEIQLKLEDIVGLTTDRMAPFAIKDSIMWDIKAALASKANRSLIVERRQEAADIQKAEEKVSSDLPLGLKKQLPDGLVEAAESVREYPLYTIPLSSISVEVFRELADSTTKLRHFIEEAGKLGLSPIATLAEVARLRDQMTVLQSLSGAIASDLKAELYQPGFLPIFERAKTEGEELAVKRKGLADTFSVVGELPAAPDLRRVRDDLKTAGSSIFGRIFSGHYRSAKRETLKWVSLPAAYKYPKIISDLETLEALSTEEVRYTGDIANQKLGGLFRGVLTNWTRLGSVLTWADSARTSGLSFDQAQAIVVGDRLGAIARLRDEIDVCWDNIDSLIASACQAGALAREEIVCMPLESLIPVLNQWHAWLEARIAPLQALEITLSLKDLTLVLKGWETIDQRKAALAADSRLKSCLADESAGIATNWAKIQATQDWIDEMAKVGIPRAWLKALLDVESQANWAEIVQLITQAAGVWEEIHRTFAAFEPHLANATIWLKKHHTKDLSLKVSALITEGSFLPTWAQYCRLRRRGDDLGVRAYLDGWQSGKIPTEQLADMFRLAEYRRLASQETKSNPALCGFSLESHEQVRAKFQKLDAELTALNRQAIAATIHDREVPEGNDRGPKRDWTDKALIQHQTSLQRKQLPLRVLTSRAFGALQGLKPCMMMSPLTVAQFLDPHLPQFDVLVMDEASQILPEDALGAIARAKQLVVVGDPKQLPPTGFFKVAADDDDGNDDDDTLLEGADSILDSCEAAFSRTKRLKWHYRSLHESLIAFSNAEFYDNELLVFPSPVRDASRYGVRFHKVDGLYQNNCNPIEGRAVIDAVVGQLRSDPSKSVAVITFNLKQKELMEDLLAEERRKDPLLADLLETTEAGQEPLIIRNLESIQGEQRDIIFISVNFAPETSGGTMAQRFGPVNSRNGWRRLNVMFSRAKERMEVFSSVFADSIIAEPGAKTGAAYLSRFLHYAQTGNLDRTILTKRPPDSDFELSVADYIRKDGYEVEPQVGVAGFFIDLAVSAPGQTNRYILGVECDGAAYHSSRVARDRDRIREGVLRGRGWNLHRIWSTDWFQDRAAAMKRLSTALKTAKK